MEMVMFLICVSLFRVGQGLQVSISFKGTRQTLPMQTGVTAVGAVTAILLIEVILVIRVLLIEAVLTVGVIQVEAITAAIQLRYKAGITTTAVITLKKVVTVVIMLHSVIEIITAVVVVVVVVVSIIHQGIIQTNLARTPKAVVVIGRVVAVTEWQ